MRPSSTKAFFLWLVAFAVALTAVPADAAAKKPNIIFIMGDDIGMWNISAYHRGMMAGRTPNIDKLAAEGAIFTDYYAEASCTAGRANFITGELPARTTVRLPLTTRPRRRRTRRSTSTCWVTTAT